MEFTSVASSNLNGVHYAPQTQQLTVEFKNGTRYRYDNVPQDEYDALMDSSSKGSFFINNIRDSYRATRV